jgi:small-conductance mechanosensitive channel
MWMKAHQWIVTLGLLTLVFAAAAGLILTRQSAQPNTAPLTRRPPIVDEQPLITARALTALAADWEEQRYSRQALKLADHSVDVAFSYEMRQATEHPAAPTPESKKLFAQENQSDAAVRADQARIDQLGKQLATAKDERAHDNLQQQIDLTKAQLELDQDELEDVKSDLIRSGADRLSRIQRQFNRHEAAQKEYESSTSQTSAANNNQNNPQAGSSSALVEFSAWNTLRAKNARLQQALDEAKQAAGKIRQSHDTMQGQVAMEVSNKDAITQQAKGSIDATSGTDTSSASSTAKAITSLHQISVDQKDLSDLDKRIQDQEDLVTAYTNWIDVVKVRQRAVAHEMLQSAMLILLVVFGVYLGNRLVDHFFVGLAVERTRLHTLRGVIRFAVQALGLSLILLILFGVPNQMSTILGLAGAGLTVACKDFIMGFIGWFLLMGRNGLRVGDWVEIDGVVGEVVEIGLLRTVLLETGNWTESGHPTGRKVAFVNSYAIEGHFFNFSTTGQWLWDDVEILVPATQDPYPIIDSIQKMVTEQTKANVVAAEQEWERSTSRYRAQSVSAAPAVSLRPTSSGIEVHVRYITRAGERHATKTRLYQALVELLHARQSDPAVAASAKAAR